MVEVERLLRYALVPVDPPEAMSDRFARALTEITETAAGELADWELLTMRDPRKWARPIAAIVVGGVAGGALIVVQARQRQRRLSRRPLTALNRGARGLGSDVRKRLRR